MRLIIFGIVFFSFLPTVSFAACRIGDRTTSRSVTTERQTCRTSGYCYSYGHNPRTGRYERYYGRHSDCPGTKERQVERLRCQRGDGSIYFDDDYSSWGICRAR